MSEIPALRPLATPNSYLAAYEAVDESYGKEGVWADVAVGLYDSMRENKPLHKAYLEVMEYGAMLDIDYLAHGEQTSLRTSKMQIGRAFAQGYLQQLDAQQLIYTDNFTLNQALKVFETETEAQEFEDIFDDEERHDAQHRFMQKFSVQGLHQMGSQAHEYIDKWSKETHLVDRRLQRAYAFGHGAMASCGVRYQSFVNDYLVARDNIEDRLGEEVSTFLTTGTSEE